MVQCSECNLWRLIFSKERLSGEQRNELSKILEQYMYSCGASLQELDLPQGFENVEIRDHDCYDPIEVLYYSAKFEPICVYCAEPQPYTCENKYPQCNLCAEKPSTTKRK